MGVFSSPITHLPWCSFWFLFRRWNILLSWTISLCRLTGRFLLGGPSLLYANFSVWPSCFEREVSFEVDQVLVRTKLKHPELGDLSLPFFSCFMVAVFKVLPCVFSILRDLGVRHASFYWVSGWWFVVSGASFLQFHEVEERSFFACLHHSRR